MSYLDMKSSLSKAKNTGSAHSGSHHWLLQRMTSMVMLITIPWMLYVIHSICKMDVSGVIEAMRSPSNITPIIIFISTGLYHANLGVQVVIEDYIHDVWIRKILIILVQLFTLITTISSAVAILSLMVL
jgi:succinate dehydrogenase / fumarate reductase membrane anchor subunit